MKLRSVCFVNCFLWMNILGISSTTSYYDGLIKYLKEESKLHQVVYVRDGEMNNTDPIMNSLIKVVNKNFPSLSITLDTIKSPNREENLDVFYKSRRKTLFVLDYKNITMINKFMDISQQKAYRTPLPRCLIINSLPLKPESLKTILADFWRKNFLDITFLLPSQKHQVMQTKGNHIEEVPIMSTYNPFTVELFYEKVSSVSRWFPNKLRDLNGYKLNFVFMMKHRIGPQSRFAELLTHAMNCNYIKNFVNENGVLNQSGRSDLKMSTRNQLLPNFNPDKYFSLKILGISSFQFVIPKTVKYSNSLSLSEEFWYMSLATIDTIVIIRLVAFFMRFKKKTWEILNISKMIMGMSTERVPNNFSERLLLGSFLIACIFYSGYFYSVILDITWRSESEISNLQELADSTLTPMMQPIMQSRLQDSSFPHIQMLGKKAVTSAKLGFEYKCLQHLIHHQNVSCLFPHSKYIVNEHEKRNKMKILPEAATYYTPIWEAGFNSPYEECFNEIILRAYEFGLLQDFFPSMPVDYNNMQSPEEIPKEKLFFVLSYVLIIGYSLSVIAFLFEIFQEKFGRRMYAYYTRFRFAN